MSCYRTKPWRHGRSAEPEIEKPRSPTTARIPFGIRTRVFKPAVRVIHRMGARTIVDCRANTEDDFRGRSSRVRRRRMRQRLGGTGAAKRGARLMRRSATCAVGLAASCPTLRSGSPVPERSVLRHATENQLTLSSEIRMTLRWRSGKRRCAMHASKSSRKHFTRLYRGKRKRRIRGPPLSREAGLVSPPLRQLGGLGRSATIRVACPAITRVATLHASSTPPLLWA